MDLVVTILQLVIALGIFNVWVLRFGKASPWRGGDAGSMQEEFAAYGLPVWFMWVVGGLKLLFAALLIIGIWVPSVTQPAALGIAVLMLGAVAMHVKVKDLLKKSLPAFTLLVLSLIVAFA